MENSDTNKGLKILVVKAAVQRVKDGMVCGIGAGPAVTFLITELGRRIREEGLNITVWSPRHSNPGFCASKT